MPPHPRADGPHHSSAETSLPRKPSVPESISSGGFEPATSRCVARSSSLFNVAAYDAAPLRAIGFPGAAAGGLAREVWRGRGPPKVGGGLLGARRQAQGAGRAGSARKFDLI